MSFYICREEYLQLSEQKQNQYSEKSHPWIHALLCYVDSTSLPHLLGTNRKHVSQMGHLISQYMQFPKRRL